MIKTGVAVLFVTGIGIFVFFWFDDSGREDKADFLDDKDEQIFILEGDKIVEVLQPSEILSQKRNDKVAKRAPAANKGERIARGREVYHKICIACHQPDGQGIPTIFPPLAKSDFLNRDKQRAIHIVTNGLVGEIVVNGAEFHNLMPKPGLNDEEIANVLTFVYSQWSNNGSEVTPDEVAEIRQNGVK